MSTRQISNKLKSTGAYNCPHISVEKLEATGKGCCGQGSDYAMICSLANVLCPGLAPCPRLDLETKSELIKQWNQDIKCGAFA